MAIEVLCTGCNAKLRVPDEAAGAQAKCPHCQEVFDVVESPPSSVPPVPPPVQPPIQETNPYAEPPPDDANPYAPPHTDVTPQTAAHPMELGSVDAGLALQLAWDLFKKNLPILLTTHATFFVIQILVGMAQEGAQQSGEVAAVMAVMLLSYAVQWFIGIGLIVVTLGVARGQNVEFGALFSGAPWFLRVAVFNIFYGLLVGLGLLLFIIPGIYLGLRFWPGAYFIVDRNCGVMEAFTMAGEFTEGNKLACLLVGLLSFAVMVGGVLLFCIGVFFAYPLVVLMWTISYLMMTRQPIQRPVA